MAAAVSDLTERQEKVLEYIIDHLSEHDCQPSLREICQAMGIRNVNGVVCHINALEEKGYVKRRAKNISRSLEIDWDRYHANKKGRRR